jgi:hypothetical protein
MKIDWPLNPLLLLKNICTNSIDIKRFCPNAAYTPLLSSSKIASHSITLNKETINNPKAVHTFNDDKFLSSFL